jgi:sugar phosphate permease
LATGIAVTGSSFGLILTGPLVPFVLNIFEQGGWRYAWVVLGLIVLLIALLALMFLRDHPRDKGLAPVGVDTDASDPEADKNVTANGSQRSSRSWALVYRSAAVWHLALIYTTFGFSYIIYVTFFARYLQGEIGFTKEAAGRLWQIVGWISIFCGIIWGWVSDVIGRNYGLALVSFLQGSVYLMFAVWPTHVGVIFSAILFGLTAWSIPAIMASACGDRLGPRLAPAALGFITLFFGIGQAAGPTVAGRISDLASSFTPAFILAAGVAWFGALASLLLKGPPSTASRG